jgi:MYXO-CTERM domain-containing protein
LADTLRLTITPNQVTHTPGQNADFVWFENASGLGSIRAYELEDSPNGSNTVTLELHGRISSLDPTAFANATGGGFIHPSVEPIPEPAGLALLGLLAAWSHRRR